VKIGYHTSRKKLLAGMGRSNVEGSGDEKAVVSLGKKEEEGIQRDKKQRQDRRKEKPLFTRCVAGKVRKERTSLNKG